MGWSGSGGPLVLPPPGEDDHDSRPSRRAAATLVGGIAVRRDAAGGGEHAGLAQSTAPAAVAPATLELWLGGTLTTSTPGTPYETWVNHIIERFKAASRGRMST